MAFDRTDPADLTALNSEIINDPISMGYSQYLDADNNIINSPQMLQLLNDADNNVGGETAGRIFDVEAMLDALVPLEFGDNQTATDAAVYVSTLVQYSSRFGAIEQYKTDFRNLFALNSATVTNLDAQTSPLSRAEVLFGQETLLTKDDLSSAMSI